MVRTGHSGFGGRDHFGLETWPESPTWCFQRFGMSCTGLDDRRVVCIAGEHEDYYDPDFFIYNDIAVLRPRDGEEHVERTTCGIELFGYGESRFPPTDFHTATLVGDQIWVIGNVGYPEQRRPGTTPIFVLDTRTWKFRKVHAEGDAPGWIHRHAASYDAATHSIVVGSGEVWNGEAFERADATWRLELRQRRWERLPRATMRRRFSVCSAEPDDPSILAVSGLRSRLHPVIRGSGDLETWSAEIGRALVVYEGFSDVELTIDGLLDDRELGEIVDGIGRNVQARTGAPWELRACAEYR